MTRSPLALLIFPPIYDFALYDLFLKPFSLLRLARWLVESGWRVRLVNALDYRDAASRAALGPPVRRSDGTGKLFRQVVQTPPPLREEAGGPPRRFARYGIVPEELERRLRGEPPALVLVSSGMTYWYPGVREAIERVRGRFPRTPVVLGGIYASLCPEHARRVSGADVVIEGDAFPALPRLLAGLDLPHGAPFTGDPCLLPEMLPEAGVLRLNRGCPFQCSYCASRLLEGGFRPGDPEAAFQQVKTMAERFGTRDFAFYDDALLVGREEGLFPFLDRVLAAGPGVRFHLPNALHLRFLDPPAARKMRSAGFARVRLGFESSCPDFHRATGGKLDVEMLREGGQVLREAGFRTGETGVYILAGLPGQHWREVEESVRHAAALGFRPEIAEYSPIPGTPLWEESCRRSPFPLAEEPLTHNNTLLPLRWPGFTPRDLVRLKELARSLAREPAAGPG